MQRVWRVSLEFDGGSDLRNVVLGVTLAGAILLTGGCGGGGGGDNTTTGQITSARILSASTTKIPSLGDLWLSTWASDGDVYMSWGDGTGPGTCYPIEADTPAGLAVDRTIAQSEQDQIVFGDDFCGAFPCDGQTVYSPCELTQAGIYRLQGDIDAFTGCEQDACIQARRIPSGIPQFAYGQNPTQRRGDKPSSLLAIDGILYWSGHQLMVSPKYGYIAYSSDAGMTWTEVPNSPWDETSHFRVLMFINMGQNYGLNTDGYVYGLGINGELVSQSAPQSVYLARVPKDTITNYASYRYYSGTVDGAPQWSASQSDAEPLANLSTIAMGAAMYHPGVGKYLFLSVPVHSSGPAMTLFYADRPWGPWSSAQVFDGEFYIPGIITKGTGTNSFYFTAAGGAGTGNTYQLTIGKIEMTVN